MVVGTNTHHHHLLLPLLQCQGNLAVTRSLRTAPISQQQASRYVLVPNLRVVLGEGGGGRDGPLGLAGPALTATLPRSREPRRARIKTALALTEVLQGMPTILQLIYK